ncbi:hypothetical protein BGX30_001908 [Mortierella sp. GBA39]|nr:hypothetical protein BGX30_001908 [Mortierella sp. GBA39]
MLAQWIIAVITLVEMTVEMRIQDYKFVRCTDCNEGFITQRKNPHQCAAAGFGDKVVKNNNNYETRIHT